MKDKTVFIGWANELTDKLSPSGSKFLIASLNSSKVSDPKSITRLCQHFFYEIREFKFITIWFKLDFQYILRVTPSEVVFTGDWYEKILMEATRDREGQTFFYKLTEEGLSMLKNLLKEVFKGKEKKIVLD
jgi:hypothetical protein